MATRKSLIPHNIANLQPYVAGKSIAEVQELYNPDRISKLASNENRLGCSSNVKKALENVLNKIQDYPDPLSTSLREKIAIRNDVNPENVILASGSESLISIICRTFFLNHENAVTAAATFIGFFVQAGIRGIQVKKVPLTEAYKFDVEALLAAVDGYTKLIYLANPNNPTGTYVNKEEFKRLLTGLPEDVLLVLDEAYYEYARTNDDYPESCRDSLPENVIVLRTFSKAYGLAGLRIGYGIAEEQLIRHMQKTKLTFEPSLSAQAAALAAFQDTSFLKRSVKTVIEGKERLYRFFDRHDIHYIPSLANSVMMVMDSEESAKIFVQSMLEHGVILRRVHLFGLPNCIRITIGTQEDMDHFEKSFHSSRLKD